MKIQNEIARLTSTLQALTMQRLIALREGRHSEADQIASVQVDIDNKIQELEKKIWLNEANSLASKPCAIGTKIAGRFHANLQPQKKDNFIDFSLDFWRKLN